MAMIACASNQHDAIVFYLADGLAISLAAITHGMCILGLFEHP